VGASAEGTSKAQKKAEAVASAFFIYDIKP